MKESEIEGKRGKERERGKPRKYRIIGRVSDCFGVHQRMFHDLAIERNTRSLQRVNIARVLLGADPTGAEWQGSGTGSLAATSTIGDCCMGEASEPDHIAQNRIQREMREEKKQVENAPQEKPSRRRSNPLQWRIGSWDITPPSSTTPLFLMIIGLLRLLAFV